MCSMLTGCAAATMQSQVGHDAVTHLRGDRGVMRCVVTVVALGATACSFSMRDVPATYRPSKPPPCDTMSGPVIVDALAATATGLVGLAGLGVLLVCQAHSGSDDLDRECHAVGLGTALVGLGIASVYAYSAAKGIGKQRRCRAATWAHRRWLRTQPPGHLEKTPERRRREPAACVEWQQELARAQTVSEKLALAKRRPATCR